MSKHRHVHAHGHTHIHVPNLHTPNRNRVCVLSAVGVFGGKTGVHAIKCELVINIDQDSNI